MDLIDLAAPGDRLNEFMSDPTLTVACVLLVVVSMGWVIISRLIARNLRKAALRGIRNRQVEAMRPSRDIWTMPP
jgi:cell division protein FtsX